MSTISYEQAVSELQETIIQISANGELKRLGEAKREVLARFQQIFSKEHIPQLTEQKFRALLLFENNQHWKGISRHVVKTTADMPLLRRALSNFLYEQNPIEDRFDQLVGPVPGLGKAQATVILQIVFPEKYGIWNRVSESGLKVLNLWPNFERGESMGKRYIKINQTLLQLAKDLNVDLWTLDWVWVILPPTTSDEVLEEQSEGELPRPQEFGLERHLQEFMVDNWEKMPISQEWSIYSEPGDDEAGFEYPCDVGRIDILARHKNKSNWLIIELKKDQTSDATVGQVLRYMGWIKSKMAEPGEDVQGLIIARQPDDALLYALNAIQNVDFQLYEVEFRLKNVPKPS